MSIRSHRKPLVAGIMIAVLMAAAAVLAAEKPKIDLLRERARQLVLKQAEMGWKSWVLGEPSNQAALYREYPDLFTRESIMVTENALRKEADPGRKKALKFFLVYQQMEFIGNQTAFLSDIANDLEAEQVVSADGKLIPYRDLSARIANEPDREKRVVLAKEEYRIFDLENKVVLGRLLSETHRLAKELGYKDYLDLSAAARFVDMDSLAALCDKLLDKSEELYFRLFDEVSPIPRSQFRRSDVSRLLGGKEFDRFYPKEKLVSSLKGVLAGMSLDMNAQTNILIQDEPLPKKNPRAVCFPIVVPADVRLSIKPRGGLDDYSALFHETGHAEHFANAKTDVWEFQQLGSNAVTETYAYLLGAIPEDPVFLKEVLNVNDAAINKLVRLSAFSRLYMLRRYSAKVLYERDLHRGAGEPAKLYRQHMSRGYGFQLTDDEAKRCLTDVDAFMYSADYLQAFYLEAMLRQTLVRKFGAPWWKHKESLEFLKGLWAKGNELTGMEFANQLGSSEYSIDLLMADIKGDLL